MTDLITIFLICLTTHRLTRLLTCDWFLPVRKVRCAIARSRVEWLRVLITCPWCASVWFAAGVTFLVTLFGSVPVPLLVWPAAATVAGYLSLMDRAFGTCAGCADLDAERVDPREVEAPQRGS